MLISYIILRPNDPLQTIYTNHLKLKQLYCDTSLCDPCDKAWFSLIIELRIVTKREITGNFTGVTWSLLSRLYFTLFLLKKYKKTCAHFFSPLKGICFLNVFSPYHFHKPLAHCGIFNLYKLTSWCHIVVLWIGGVYM